jgi:uroporphyrinogen decarboxylase
MVEFLSDYYIRKFKYAAERIQLDWIMFWEDMAYKNGSLINPSLYKKIFMPFYDKIMPLVERAGIKVVLLDCDGSIEELIPLWLDAGITTMHPMEATAGMDVRAVRKKYGKTVKFLGGIDKRALALGKDAINKEVAPKIEELMDAGGFIVECDHAVPPDVSYDNFRYYRDLVRKISEK